MGNYLKKIFDCDQEIIERRPSISDYQFANIIKSNNDKL